VITAKQDWFTGELEAAGVLVGGGESISAKLMLPDSQCSFRFAASPDSTWMYFLTVGFGQSYSSTYEEAIFSRLGDLGVSEMFPNLRILFYSDHRPGSFRINFGGNWETVNPMGLQKKFHEVDPSFIGALGNVKPINKSVNDLFQTWSRAYLNPYCVVNDIDAIAKGLKTEKIIELKRPVESVADWKPYKNDLRNYQRSKELAGIAKSEIINIAYNINKPEGSIVQIFTTPVKNEAGPGITYSKTIVSSSEAVDYILDRNQIRLMKDSSSR
jgi:hypothetical protein